MKLKRMKRGGDRREKENKEMEGKTFKWRGKGRTTKENKQEKYVRRGGEEQRGREKNRGI